MLVVTIQALSDNYIYMLLDEFEPLTAAVVDPGDAEPVLEYLQETGRVLTAILNTHHHRDHTGGNTQLLWHYPGIPVCGGAADRGRIPGQTLFLKENDEVPVSGISVSIKEIPGHTRAHIGYWFHTENGSDFFAGDTIFGASIGNLFESTPETMFRSLQKIRNLPGHTRIWCAHEYTRQCVRDSMAIDPENQRLAARLRQLQSREAVGQPTVPLHLEEELLTNPFLRWDDPHLYHRFGTQPGLETFRHICALS